MINDKLKGMVGLAIKAGRAVSGSFAVEGAVNRRKAKLVLVDGRASANRVSETQALCERRGVKCVLLKDSGMLEELLGRDNSTVLAIIDEGFAVTIQEILKKE
jgi:ribosomal protein L7Ae-like RNA K-turn-binding protein